MKKLLLRFIYGFLVKPFLKIIVGVRISDASFLLKEEQFIIVANHNSHLDTMTLLAALPGKILHCVKPVAAADHFGKSKLQEKLSSYFVNALLIPRKRDKANPVNDPINKMIQALDEGFSLILFPEGTRGEPEKIQPLKPGIALLLLKRPNVKYVPAFMVGMGKALPKGDNIILPHVSSLIFGKPKNITSDDVNEILKQIENDISHLKNQMLD